MSGSVLETERLLLRPWRDDDLDAFAALNADPKVMEHFPRLSTRDESEAMILRIRGIFAEHGFGLWALEVKDGAPFIGFCGLMVPAFQAHFTPCVEIGWRLAAEHWGQGYAREAAREALAYGFDQARLSEIVSFTVPANVRSQKVMQAIGMTHDPRDDFDHPALPPGHALRRHVLYRIQRPVR